MQKYNFMVKRLAMTKEGIYDGKAMVEQVPTIESAKDYMAIAQIIMTCKTERENYEKVI